MSIYGSVGMVGRVMAGVMVCPFKAVLYVRTFLAMLEWWVRLTENKIIGPRKPNN